MYVLALLEHDDAARSEQHVWRVRLGTHEYHVHVRTVALRRIASVMVYDATAGVWEPETLDAGRAIVRLVCSKLNGFAWPCIDGSYV